MYSDLNTITLTGNLGRDPETRYTTKGTKVVSFPLASSRNFKRGDEWEQETVWIDIKVFGPRGDAAEQLRKGEKVALTGQLRSESWEKDGTTHYKHVVVASKIQRFAKVVTEGPADAGDTAADVGEEE